jgi:resuscitation-promoting factor RpfA
MARSARGRRRHWRQAAGATAAAGALLASTTALPEPAQAAPPSPWDRVAACESSGRWHVNTHNHYYGGLQFWQPTWVDHGGTKYAPRADLATRQQQIEVARRVLAAQGPKAWPVCGKKAELTRANGQASRAPLPAIGPYVRTVPAAKPARAAAPKAKPQPRVQRYQVRPGDSLSGLAERFGVSGGWQALWHYNRTNVPNPNVILVGQLLQIP